MSKHLDILLEGTVEGFLFGTSLETTVTEFGGGIDEFEGNFFESGTLGVGEEGFTEGNNSLLDTRGGTLDHDPVVGDHTVSGETTHGGDSLLGKIVFGGSRVLVFSSSDTVDLLVQFSTVVETVLTSTGNRVHDTGRMPSSDTSDLTETFVCLSGKFLNTPTSDNTFETVTFGDGDGVDHFILSEDGLDVDSLFKVFLSESNFVSNGTTVNLDFHNVGLLLCKRSLTDLGVCNDTDNSTVLGDTFELRVDGFSSSFRVFLSVTGESLLLGFVPVLVETTLDFFRQMFSPDGGESTETTGGFNVSNNTNDDHWGSFDDGDSFDNFLLVHLGSRSVEISDNVGHTSLVTEESGKVDRLGSVILGEGFTFTSVSGASFFRQETKGTTTGVLVLTVRHF